MYLVTNNELIPEGLDIYQQLERSLQNGTTLVQLREKHLDTGDFIRRAEKVHAITQKYNVPLLINDRIDVALAVDAEGVHIGQDDMDPALVRKMIGDGKILGVTTRSEEELMGVINSTVLVDYVGIGTAYSTTTKNVARPPLGPEGIKNLLKIISEKKPELKSVIIGGLSKYNIAHTLSTCAYDGFNTNGVAVVSGIMAQQDAGFETKEILDSVKVGYGIIDQADVASSAKPSIVHFITNSVAQNLSANVCIAVGGSPIMSQLSDEFRDFASLSNAALVLNTGTPTEGSIEIYKTALKAYNSKMSPIVYDPVACGATKARRHILKELMKAGHFTVIKGNLAEMATVAGVEGSLMRGVDSTMSLDIDKAVVTFRKLAKKTKSVIVVTGETDIIVDGITPREVPTVCTIDGGDVLMSKITASGCCLGGVIARFAASTTYLNTFEATVRALSLYKEAGFKATQVSEGPGSFLPNFVDQLHQLSNSTIFENTTVKFLT